MLMSSNLASFRIKGPGLTRLILAIAFSSVFVFQALAAEAQPTPTPTPKPPVQMTVKSVQTYTKTEGEAGMGEWIVVEVNGLPAAVEKDGLNPRSFVLYLNGRRTTEKQRTQSECRAKRMQQLSGKAGCDLPDTARVRFRTKDHRRDTKRTEEALRNQFRRYFSGKALTTLN